MKRFFLYTILSFFLLLPSAGQAPANSNDSIRLSLLTCAPGEEIYSLFGHTAIRYETRHKGLTLCSITDYSVSTLLTSSSASRSEKPITNWG